MYTYVYIYINIYTYAYDINMSCREKVKIQKKLKEMKIRAWRLALGGRKRLSGVSPRANADATSNQKELKGKNSSS